MTATRTPAARPGASSGRRTTYREATREALRTDERSHGGRPTAAETGGVVSQMKPLDSSVALAVLKESITWIVPDADFTQVEPNDRLRDVLEPDSLGFLGPVELLSERTGVRIDEEDHPELTTLSAATWLPVARSMDSTSSGR
ncbi:hypothetical protein ACFVH0_32765 [Streptomyces sp. NPDC127117]|uniref:hypothetical protein n=1 Tax=Streptomyces sp. NPDC127117 TaxID=3345368 RepID=UPI00363C1942